MYASSMSHWNMPQLEEINWGVFGKRDDRMVPNRNTGLLDRPLFLSDPVVKQQDEVTIDFTSTMPSTSSDSYQLHIKNKSSLMLQGTQSHTSNDVSPIISDFDKTDTCSTLPSEDVSVSDYCISESNNTDANMLYLTTENSMIESKTLTCLESQQMERNNELAYYEDMYSYWVGEEDELPWLSSNTMYSSEIASELGLQSSNYGFDTNADMEALAENFTNANCSLNNVQAVTENDNETSHYTFANCFYAEASSERNSAIVEESCNMSSKPVQNTKDCRLNGSGASSAKSENMQPPAHNGTQISMAQKILNSNFPTREMYSSAQNQQKKHFLGSSSYMQSLDQNPQLDQPTSQVPLIQVTSDIHFDEGTNQCTSYENVHSYEKFPDQSYSCQAIAPKQNIGNVYIEQNIPRRRRIFEKTNDTKMNDAGLQNSVMHHSSEIISCIQQLQNVMKQMDPKTKLCIRDSLYRLAKSASRRNGFATQNCSESMSESKGITDRKASKRSEEFMDVETSTNPLDRAVAYLLLHDPADSPRSTMPANNTRSLNSKLMEFENQAIFGGCSDMETDLP